MPLVKLRQGRRADTGGDDGQGPHYYHFQFPADRKDPFSAGFHSSNNQAANNFKIIFM
jgi:hypothetical protein